MLQNLSSAAVVIGAFRVNYVPTSTKFQDSSYDSIYNCEGWYDTACNSIV